MSGIGQIVASLGSALVGGAYGSYQSGKDRRFAQHLKDQGLHEMLGHADNHRVKVEGASVDQINRDRDFADSQRNMRSAFDIGAEYGLTPTEIAGSPVPGGTTVSGSNTLGNAHTQQTTQMMASADRAADREAQIRMEGMRSSTELMKTAMQTNVAKLGQDVAMRGQDIDMSKAQLQAETQRYVSELSAKASITSSSISAAAIKEASRISADASKYTADTNRLNVLGQLKLTGQINDAQIAQMSAQTAVALQDKAIKAALHDERWARLFSSMSAENVVASALAVKHGVPLENVLKGENATPEMMKAIQGFSDEVLGRQSWLNIESEGVSGVMKDAWKEFKGVTGLGSLFSQ